MEETFSMLPTLCAGNSLVTVEFPSQRPVKWSFNVFFDLHLNKRLSKQLRRQWFGMPWYSLWRHCIFFIVLYWKEKYEDHFYTMYPWICISLPITMTSQWAWWRLRSPASRLFTQPFIQTQIKENIKAPRHWPLCGEFTGTGEFPAQRASYVEYVSIWWRHHARLSLVVVN